MRACLCGARAPRELLLAPPLERQRARRSHPTSSQGLVASVWGGRPRPPCGRDCHRVLCSGRCSHRPRSCDPPGIRVSRECRGGRAPARAGPRDVFRHSRAAARAAPTWRPTARTRSAFAGKRRYGDDGSAPGGRAPHRHVAIPGRCGARAPRERFLVLGMRPAWQRPAVTWGFSDETLSNGVRARC